MSTDRPTLVELIEAALRKPRPRPMFAVGQTVRVKRTLYCNVDGVEDILGAEGVVESIQFGCLNTERVSYKIRFGPHRVEPFDQDELDWRYARKTTTPSSAALDPGDAAAGEGSDQP